MIDITSWVVPASGSEREIIIGRVVSIAPESSSVIVCWLSNERGLWMSIEAISDLYVTNRPEVGFVEAIMCAAHPVLPWRSS